MIPINEFYYQQGFGFDDNNLRQIYVKKVLLIKWNQENSIPKLNKQTSNLYRMPDTIRYLQDIFEN